MDTVRLTKREKEVAEYIAWGASQKEVANRLGVSRSTVDNTLRKVYAKLHIGKINELSAWWFCHQYHISEELSPIKRIMGVSLLLSLLLLSELQNTQFCRYRQSYRPRTEYIRRIE